MTRGSCNVRIRIPRKEWQSKATQSNFKSRAQNAGVRRSVSTYRCITSDQGRILQCTEERLSKIMNVEDTVTLLGPVGVIAKRMNPNMSEIGISGEPFFWPEV